MVIGNMYIGKIITQTQNAKYRIISNKTVKFSIRGKTGRKGGNGAFFNFPGRRRSKRGKCPENEAKSNPCFKHSNLAKVGPQKHWTILLKTIL